MEESIGFLVEWYDKLTKFKGIIYDVDSKGNRLAFNNITLDEILIPKKTRLLKVRRADKEIAAFKLKKARRAFSEAKDTEAQATLDELLSHLESKCVDPANTLARAINQKQPNAQVKVTKKTRLDLSNREEDFVNDDNTNVETEISELGDGSKLNGIKSPSNNEYDSVAVNETAGNQELENDDSEDDDDYSDDDDEDDDESDENEDDDEVEDDDSDTDDDSDDDEDDEVDDESTDDDSSGDDDASDDDDDESSQASKTVEVKVLINKTQELRGFCVQRASSLTEILEDLDQRYHCQTKLSYRDPDGDVVNVESSNDMEYAMKMHQLTRSKAKGGRVIRLFADVTRVAKRDRATRPRLALRSSIPTSQLVVVNSSSSSKLLESEVEDFTQFSGNLTGEEDTLPADFLRNKGVAPNADSNADEVEEELLWQRGDVIGEGSFGQVFSGINLSTGEMIAVKEVNLGNGSRHREQAEALQMEIKILGALDHPNIIKYLGAECSSGTLRIFLELATEGSLKDVLKKFGPLSEPLVRLYTSQIVAGLGFLHLKGFIHRDIKPGNILLDKGVVKLADFGCSTASRLDNNNALDSDRGHDSVVGTTVYMSPEVMQGEGNFEELERRGYGKKADVWSLGVTLTEMVHGVPPFRNGAAAVYSIIVKKELPTLPKHMSQDAHHALSRCLVIDPSLRADCKELASHPFCAPQSTTHLRKAAMEGSVGGRTISTALSKNPILAPDEVWDEVRQTGIDSRLDVVRGAADEVEEDLGSMAVAGRMSALSVHVEDETLGTEDQDTSFMSDWFQKRN